MADGDVPISPPGVPPDPPERPGAPTAWTRAVSRGREALARVPRRVRLAALVAALAALVPLVLWERCGIRGCPNVERLTAYRPGGAPRLLDQDGKEFATLAPVEGALVRLGTLPRVVSEAVIAVEDRRFRDHGGIDLLRAWGALFANLRARSYEQGFSTLTMQLARTVFAERIPLAERTLSRKLLEIRVAREIEDEFTKDQILELYLNHVWFGNGARGIEAAARHYFAKPARELHLHEAALLAGLLKAPSHYDPRRHPERAKERRDLVLSLMERQRRITPSQADQARQAGLGVVRRARAGRAPQTAAPWFVEHVRRELEEIFGEALYDEPLRVHTAIDVTLQAALEQELDRQLRAVEKGAAGAFQGVRYTPSPESEEDYGYLQGAAVVLDARSGEVRAWVGGRDFRHSRFDRVLSGTRQTGSAFKPFVYAAALAAGHTLAEHVHDAPLEVRLDARRTWEPRNYDGTYEGEMSVRDALVRSKNVPTVRLATDVGVPAVAAVARRAGLVSRMDLTPSLALGTVAVSPLELATAYTAFAGLGEAVQPRFVRRVERPDGAVLWQSDAPVRRQALDPGVAYLVNDVLSDAVRRGTGTAVPAAGVRGPVAGKTGTTSDAADAWFVGYTPEIVGVVWVGFDRPRPITPKATGGAIAAPVWGRAIARWQRGRDLPPPWRPPGNVVAAMVDPASGLLLEQGCHPAWDEPLREYFIRGHLPGSTCPGDEGWMVRRDDDWWGRDDDEDEEREEEDRRWRRRREEVRRAEAHIRELLRQMRRRAEARRRVEEEMRREREE